MGQVIMKNKRHKLVKISPWETSVSRDKYKEVKDNGEPNYNDTVYVIKKKINSGIWVFASIITRKRYDNVFVAIFNRSKLETDKDYEKRAINEFKSGYSVIS